MDTAVPSSLPTTSVQTSPKNNHQPPKKKVDSPKHTIYFHNSNRNLEQNSMQSLQDRPKLVARRRLTNTQNKATSDTAIQALSPTVRPQSAMKFDPQPQSSSHKSIPHTPNGVYESRVAQTFRDYQRKQGQSQGQSRPRNAYNNQYGPRPGRRDRERYKEYEEIPDPDAHKKVLASGFPSYTQSQDLARVLSELGPSQILRIRNRLAVVLFETEQLAQKAIESSEELYIYGEFIQIYPYTNAHHVEELFRSYKKVINTKKDNIIKPSKIDLSGDFSQQFNNILAAVRLTKEEVVEITQLYVDLEDVLSTVWPGCQAIPFGSIPTGLGIKSSDADCYVAGCVQGRDAACFVSRARRALAARPDLFSQLVAIPRANTPIVKFLHVPTARHCDVSAKTPLGSQNSRLIKYVMDAAPGMVRVAVALKYWARVHELSGTGRLTNYALAMLLLYYMQQVQLAPPVRLLQGPSSELIVDHWDAGFAPRPDLVRPTDRSTAELLGGFFEFYAGFDFENLVVCPLLGAPLRKASFEKPETLPPELERYARNVELNLVGPLRHGTAFCVQDPFELSHNVASAVSARLAREIVSYVKFAALAYAADRELGSAAFLRTILLARPKPEPRRVKTRRITRIYLIPRATGVIPDADWRAVVRRILLDTIFASMLQMKLERHEGAAADTPAAEVDESTADMSKERYRGRADRPVWRRKPEWRRTAVKDAAALVRRHERIARDLLAGPEAAPLQLDLELGFRDTPRACYALVELIDGDLDAFGTFVRFFHTCMFDWFQALLAAHLEGPASPPVTSLTRRQDVVTSPARRQDVLTSSARRQDAVTLPERRQDAVTLPERRQDAVTSPTRRQDAAVTLEAPERDVTRLLAAVALDA